MASLFFIIVDALFIISIGTIIFYAFILFVMALSKNEIFHQTFFRMFIFTGIFDIMTVVAQEWIRADFKLGFGHRFEMGTRLMMTFTGTNFLIHVFGSVLMTLNRYTASCKPTLHRRFWTNTRVKYMLLAAVLFSYVAYVEWFLTKCVYQQMADGWKLIGREKETLAARLIGALAIFIVEIVNIILITCAVKAIRRQNRKHSQKKGQEVNLIILTAITCPIELLQTIYDLSIVFDIKCPIVIWIESQFDIYFLVMMTVNAYAIVILSRAVRLEIMSRLSFVKIRPCIDTNHKTHSTVLTLH